MQLMMNRHYYYYDDDDSRPILSMTFSPMIIGTNVDGRCRYFFRQCPRACDNFKCLCTGERGKSKHSGKVLHYKGSSFHRIVKGFVMQGGDYLFNDGRGGETIYGMKFGKDEVCIFIVSMRVILQPLTSMYPSCKFYNTHLITRFKQKNSP